MKIRIEITKGPDFGKEFVLNTNERLTIGRGGVSEIQMEDELISREHCEVKFDGKRLLLRDLGSTNKTFLAAGSTIEAIEPQKVYKVKDGCSFFAGPKSRFTANYLKEPQAQGKFLQPKATPPKSASGNSSSGNFSASIQTQPGSADRGDSSIFNLLGQVPTNSQSPENNVQFTSPPPEPSKTTNDRPAPSPSRRVNHSYERGSIAAPQDQGPSGREQVYDPVVNASPVEESTGPSDRTEQPTREYSPRDDDSGIFSGSVDQESSAGAGHPQNLDANSPAPPLAEFDNPTRPSNAFDAESIVPPHMQGVGENVREQVNEEHDDAYLKSTPKVEDPGIQPKPPEPETLMPMDSPSAFTHSVGQGSIASPGKFYEPRRPETPRQTSEQEDFATLPTSPLDDAQEAPIAVADTVQSNGLYFHTGQALTQLNGLIALISAQSKPVYCVDFTRTELEPQRLVPSGITPPKQAKDSQPIVRENESVFELDEGIEEEGQGRQTAEASEPLIGSPLFDFLPVGHKENGPILLNQSELNCELAEIWARDATIIFFGPDPDSVMAHLKNLVHTNLQTGKRIKGMLGFCWPSVMYSLFESQGPAQVSRIFGDSISHILLEDPQERHVWNLVAMTDQSNAFPILKNV